MMTTDTRPFPVETSKISASINIIVGSLVGPKVSMQPNYQITSGNGVTITGDTCIVCCQSDSSFVHQNPPRTEDGRTHNLDRQKRKQAHSADREGGRVPFEDPPTSFHSSSHSIIVDVYTVYVWEKKWALCLVNFMEWGFCGKFALNSGDEQPESLHHPLAQDCTSS